MSKSSYYQNNFIRQIIDKDLEKDATTVVRTRFPPEPNGFLHIGHAKSICLNFSIAEDYKGQCHLRFDDTNPVHESLEFIRSIKEDVQWLGFQWHGKVRYASDFFEQQYQYAIELIKKNLAYVDELSPHLIREYRGSLKVAGRNSPYRNRSIAENIKLFSKMRNGSFAEGSACLRAKINMDSSFMILRDPVLYRIKFADHHQTGGKWCIYPMYDFAHCISDALEGITHSLCTLEFQDNRRLYNWVLNNITISAHPKQYEFSRLNLEYTILSKRHLNRLVSEKIVEGWDDPRIFTLSGMRRRGYSAASIREFCRRIGVTKQDNIIEISELESCVREDLNKNAPRTMAVLDAIKILIVNLPDNYEKMLNVPNHPNNSGMGTRIIPFTKEIYIDRSDFSEEKNKNYKRLMIGKEVRLRYACVIKAESVKKDHFGNITDILCSCDINTFNKNPDDGRIVTGVIHWISYRYALSAEFRLYEPLFTSPHPWATEDIFTILNPNSIIIKQGFVESSMKNIKISLPFQFEREGYFCIDSVYSVPNKLVFNRIVRLRNTQLKKLTQFPIGHNN
ncbi:glutamine--tRNA ligase [Candidatus Erwinia haradaeae]|uniref:Glutamine--tRNA ligase n=1 Tax=Candidatus Erwinia haradaeae TaxID=1922217 RepID=A0A451D2D8_9GAMM|nr:glutamine--tRNA ligase [Candidatus Erwinia haradaeae]VFP79808.1 Glutamine--tRNA ligase [Candidatus Erwinia haradaeae]